MTRNAWGLLVALASAGCATVPAERSANPPSTCPANTAVAALRSEWVYRGAIDWPNEEAPLRAALAAALRTEEPRVVAADLVIRMFAKVDDVHSRVHIDGQTHAHFEGLSETERSLLLPQLAFEGEVAGRPEGRLLKGGIAYLLVPTMHADSGDVGPMAEAIRRCVAELAVQSPRGWVVDLRLNGGGNLMPMLLGLAPLLDPGASEVVAGTLDAEGRLVQEWLLRGDALLWRDARGERVFAPVASDLAVKSVTAPVAVLIGPLTRSSGQALALAFRGRPQTLLLGAPTARGYTTVTAPVELGPGASLSLAVGFMTDRAGRPERERVDPERVVDATVSSGRIDDPAVEAGRAWIERSASAGGF